MCCVCARAIPSLAHRGASPETSRRRSEAWRPAAAACNRLPREARDPARQALRPGCEELAARIRKATARCCRAAGAQGDGSAAPRPKIATVERREASVPRHGTQGASQAPGVPQYGTPHGCLARTRTSLGAPPTPRFGVSEAKVKNPGRKKRAAGTRRCCSMPTHNPANSRVSGNPGSPLARGRTESKTRAEQELAEQRRLAPVLREAHARLGLWRTCDDKTCRRTGSCGGDVDQCGARVAPQGWAWLHQVIKAMREGKSQSAAVEAANFAALGYRERVTISWPNYPFWEPLEFFMRNDGTMIRTTIAPAQPDIDPQFIALAASPWLPTALDADART